MVDRNKIGDGFDGGGGQIGRYRHILRLEHRGNRTGMAYNDGGGRRRFRAPAAYA